MTQENDTIVFIIGYVNALSFFNVLIFLHLFLYVNLSLLSIVMFVPTVKDNNMKLFVFTVGVFIGIPTT